MSSSTHSPSEKSPLLKASVGDVEVKVKHRVMPQTIAHRGFNANVPENTMMAFKAAVADKVDALETDLHLSRDGVVVLCHDASLRRTYGVKAKVRDLTWEELSQLRTLREPHLPMPRLADLLEYLTEPGLENIWLMLDIKRDDDAEVMMRTIAATFASVPCERPWSERVTPCCWDAKYIKLSMKYLPDFHITFLGFSTTYARCLTEIPNISFSILHYTLASPSGARFIRDMKRLGLPVYCWTLNTEDWMQWAIRQGISGVITDQVALFHRVCDGMDDDSTEVTVRKPLSLSRTLRFWGEMIRFYMLVTIFMTQDRLRNGSARTQVRRALDV